jgi:hypothetical protein
MSREVIAFTSLLIAVCLLGTPTAAQALCTPSSTRMCLQNNRFSLTVNWRTANSSGAAQVVSYSTTESGLFWFFSNTNWEMMVKVLNACSFNNRYWVYTGVTTDVGWTMTVTDTLTNTTKIYSSSLGTVSCPILDSSAFATCP